MDVRLIGIDCATNPKNVGLALTDVRTGRARAVEAMRGEDGASLGGAIGGWMDAASVPVVLALDAPLGWPAVLANALPGHSAGSALPHGAHALFRRRTDDEVHSVAGKRPLDVGADRIARCAHAALALLQRIRQATGQEIPLAWAPGCPSRHAAIEVYPAATLAGRRLNTRGYKSDDGRATRALLLRAVGAEMEVPAAVRQRAEQSDHVFDARICTLAALDFVRGLVHTPSDLELARREGWIWFRGP